MRLRVCERASGCSCPTAVDSERGQVQFELSLLAIMLSVRERGWLGCHLGLQQASLGACCSVRGTPGVGDAQHGRPRVSAHETKHRPISLRPITIAVANSCSLKEEGNPPASFTDGSPEICSHIVTRSNECDRGKSSSVLAGSCTADYPLTT